MKKTILTLVAIVAMTATASAQGYGIAFGELEVTAENATNIFGDGTANYDPNLNQLVLQEDFDYHLSKNFVSINTGRDFTIRLAGNAEIYAAVDCSDNLIIETEGHNTLKITANISGSALRCPNLILNDNVTLNLLSRNSSETMHALECTEWLTVNNADLYAEVTTARLAVASEGLTLNDCWLKKPKGGVLNPIEGGICYADGTAAKQVCITREGFGIGENPQEEPQGKVEKRFENGQIVIIKDGKKYNAAGQRIRRIAER